MQRKPLFWFLLSLLCLAGAMYFWHWGDQMQAERAAAAKANARPDSNSVAPKPHNQITTPAHLAATKSNPSTSANSAKSRYPYRLANTDATVGKLLRNDKAILLANALIDTGKPVDFTIPQRLRAPENNGTYVVQARGPLDDNFRALLQSAGAAIVSYIPNNAYLVRVGDSGAQQISASAQTQSVLAYEPYYKLDPSLLKMAMEQPASLPPNSRLDLTLFADAYQATLDALKQLGAQVSTQDRSPFGPLVTVQAKPGTLAAIASLPGVEGVAASPFKRQANDLDRVRLNVAVDSVTASTYLGLSGSNVVVNINDTDVDKDHPDLTGRVTTGDFLPLRDRNGHGTHVAGTILGSGAASSTVTSAQGSVTNANFRGMAPNANAYVLSFDELDSFLQEAPALTNVLISNNSWNYGAESYDIHAASFDAAVRDAVPELPGSQPVLFVFSAGDNGGGERDGTGGSADSILSPGTGKNVITVGAIEQPRFITNDVVVDGITNNNMFADTDNATEVARFSSRGNVGIQIEGDFGRFKPDVVAPGTFVISDRSTHWDENAYYNPTNHRVFFYTNNVVDTNSFTSFLVGVPDGIVGILITLETNIFTRSNLPSMPIYVNVNNFPSDASGSEIGTNAISLPTNGIAFTGGDTVFFDVGNNSSSQVNFDVRVEVLTTNDVGNFFQVLSNLNSTLGAYRFESGTSMSAAGVSGILACMQEFFQTRFNTTPSPALMKALLINGSRTLSDQYDFSTQNSVQPTFQGWGLPSLPDIIPPVMTNASAGNLATMPVQFFEQSPSNALSTGQSFTQNLKLTGDASLQPLRVTLVWTDPPGNPTAGVKLVNDLDLIVSNLDTHEVFYGNDFPVGRTFTQAADTNGPPNIDSVNNVENVFLNGAVGTNFTVTVFARRVNVNAVTTNTNGIVQDFALVISSGDATTTTSPFQLSAPGSGALVTNITVSNVMVLSNSAPLLNQRVGANSQFSGSTNGTPAQWNFYIFTNTAAITNANFTNVAFITFQPVNLGLPRVGASSEIAPPNTDATRFAGADIDLYVSTDSTLTNLDTNAIAAASKAIGRLGNEVVFFTNSGPGRVYYIGVKSEDQQAAQFNLVGFATDLPFSNTDTNGNTVVTMNTVPLILPGGSPTEPKSAMLFGISTSPLQVRKVVVTNNVTAQDFGDYVGSLSQGNAGAVLNNHSLFTNVNDATETLVYDDSGESEFPNALSSSGPGSLQNFVGVQALGSAWIYTVVNDSSQTDTGTINAMNLLLEPQFPPNSGAHRLPSLPANAFYYGFVDVPPNATNLTISVTGNTGPLDLLLRQGTRPTFNAFDKEVLNVTNATISLSKYDTPPLNAGRYFFAIHTHNAEANLSLIITLQYGLTPESALTFQSVGNEPLLDDAVTDSFIHVSKDGTIVSAEVGVRIDHTRESDLVLTLISPQGTRVLLAENRGGTDTNGYGNGTNFVLAEPPASSGGSATATNTIQVGANQGTIDISYNFYTAPDEMAIFYDGNKIYDTGLISGSNTIAVPFGPGNSTSFQIVMNPFGNPAGTNGDKWDYTTTVVAQSLAYAWFSENTNLTTTPIKFAAPPFGAQVATLPQLTIVSNGFENVPAGNYGLNSTVDGWTVVNTNLLIAQTVPSVVTVSNFADTGSNVLALHNGTIQQVLPTIAGRKYTLAFATHGRPAFSPVSWWKADGTTSDSADGNDLFNLTTNPIVYAPGVVGQAFVVNDSIKLRAPDAPNLAITNAITFEGWINSSNDAGIIVQRGDFRPGFDPYSMGIGPPTNSEPSDLNWGVTDTNGNTTLIAGPMPLFTFVHVAGTFSINDTNATNGTLALYVNGQQVAINTNVTTLPFGPLITGLDPGLGLGNRPDLINGFSFTGLMDEMTLYNQALSPAQVQDIYAAGSAGKDPVGSTPSVTATVILDGSITNTVSGVDQWTVKTYTFTAPTNSLTVTIIPNADGMLLDTIRLIQEPQPNPANYYLPEESLDKLVGEDSLGDWQLEVLDNRVGATNPTPLLVSWQLNLQLADKVPFAIPLTSGLASSNTVPPGQFVYFEIAVPEWAQFATNILTASAGPLTLWFNQNNFPTGTNAGDIALLNNVPSGGIATLNTNGFPPLVPGQTYFLGVQNTGPAPVTFSLEVDFDITTLTNRVPIVSNSIAFGSVPRYFQFDVSSNAVAASFQILNPSGNVEMVVRKGPPLPDTSSFDYISALDGAPPQTILVLTNSTPVPVGPGRWYIGVFNNDISNVNYTIMATEVGPPTIITLTNGVAVTNVALPGLPPTNFYLFPITSNYPAALFELYKLSGDVDLTLDRDTLPFGPPFFDGSFNPGTNREQIVIRTNNIGTNIIANWYLGVPNNTAGVVTYTIRAVVSTNGMLVSGVPIQIGIQSPPPGTGEGPVLTWPAIPGECYEIDYSNDLITWNVLAIITASSDPASFTDPNPIPSPGSRFYRIKQVLCQ